MVRMHIKSKKVTESVVYRQALVGPCQVKVKIINFLPGLSKTRNWQKKIKIKEEPFQPTHIHQLKTYTLKATDPPYKFTECFFGWGCCLDSLNALCI
jgi:hypothetical protein